VHYCVPNMTANIPRTASRALTNAALPFLLELAGKGLDRALSDNAGLAAAPRCSAARWSIARWASRSP